MKETAVIAAIAIVVVLLLTGCSTTSSPKEAVIADPYELHMTPIGPMRFQPGTGNADFMMQTPVGMRWVEVPESKVEIIPVPVPSQSSY